MQMVFSTVKQIMSGMYFDNLLDVILNCLTQTVFLTKNKENYI